MAKFRNIAVIIPVYNEMSYLPRLLESLAALNSPLPFKVYFVDGCSRDGTREYLKEKLAQLPFPAVLLDNPRRVPAAALNIGIRASSEDLVVRMDGHTAFPPDYLKRLWLFSSAIPGPEPRVPVCETEDVHWWDLAMPWPCLRLLVWAEPLPG